MSISTAPPATFAMLHLLCRPTLPADAADRLAAMSGPVRWPQLPARACHYGGASWVYTHAQALGLPLPAATREQLQRAMRTEVARAMLTGRVVEDLSPLIGGDEPDALLLKGRAIEARAYPPGVLRPSNDVDLVVRPGRRVHVEGWLANAGWTRVIAGGDGHATLWHGPGRRGAIDLHDAPLSPSRFGRLTTAAVRQLFDRAVRLDDGTWSLDEISHTAVLLAHLHAGVFTDLRHLADLSCWLHAVRPEPSAVSATLTDWGGARCWRAAITALQRWDAQALPPAWRQLRVTTTWRDLAWRPLVGLAWQGSVRGHITPSVWLCRAALLSHLDAPRAYVLAQLRARRRAGGVGLVGRV